MENKVILENERTYTCDDIKLASTELLKSRALLLYIIMSSIFIALGALFIALSFVFNNDITILVSGIIIACMVFMIWGVYIFTYIKINKRDYKPADYKYTFFDDEVKVIVNSENFNQHMVLKYKDVLSGVKSKHFTYLYINRMQSFFFLNEDLNDEVYKVLRGKIKRFKGR